MFDTITVTQSHSLKVLHALNAFASCLCTLVSFGLSQATTFSSDGRMVACLVKSAGSVCVVSLRSSPELQGIEV